jgi:hypothetical protein
MWTLWRSGAHSSVCDPEADSTELLSAIDTRDFEQAPKRGYDDRSNEHGENKSKYEYPRTGSHESTGQQKKCGHAADGSVGATHQVQADRHVSSLLRLSRHRRFKTKSPTWPIGAAARDRSKLRLDDVTAYRRNEVRKISFKFRPLHSRIVTGPQAVDCFVAFSRDAD